jgi:hypothetical protein
MGSSTVSRVEIDRSRRLIQDSRVRLASARKALQQAREALARQHYLQIVCAWCQQTMRWQRSAETVWGQSSHSICFDCFAPVFWELEPGTTPPPPATHAPAGDHPSHTLPLREEARRAGGTDTMADLARYRGLLGHPANTPLTPRTGN